MRILAIVLSFFLIKNSYSNELIDLINKAEKNSPSLASAKFNKDAAYENIAIAQSKLLPQVGASGSYLRSNQTREQTSSLRTSIDNYRNSSQVTQIYFRQALIRPREYYGLSVADLQSQYGIAELANSYVDLWQRVLLAWLDVNVTHAIKVAYGKALVSQENAVKQAEKSFKNGVSTKDVWLEAESQYLWTKASFDDSDLALKSKLRILGLLVGDPSVKPTERALNKIDQLKFPYESYEKYIQRALEVNPEIATATIVESIRKKQVDQAKSDHAPTVDLVASRSRSTNESINLIGSKVNSDSIGVQITIPIFSSGGVSATVRQAVASYYAAESERKSVEHKIITQIEGDWILQEGGVEKLKAHREMVRSYSESLRAIEIAKKNGIKSWSDVASSQTNLVKRQVDYYSVLLSVYRSQIKLLSTLPVSDDAWSLWLNEIDALTK